MADAETQRLAYSDYWNGRYAEVDSGKQLHEWFRSFEDLEPFFDRHLFQTRRPETAPRILHLGSGDSTIPEDLGRRGYKNQLCVDFSSVVVENMSKRQGDTEGISWKQVDVRQMDKIASKSVDVAFDKGTLDVWIHGSPWSPPADVLDNTSRYIREVFRVLKDDGIFLYVTYRQPHFIKPLLNCEGVDWDMEVEVLAGSGSSFDYQGFALRKMPRQAAAPLTTTTAKAESINAG